MNIFEEKAKKYFDSNGFLINKIPEGESKTPDFEGKKILVEVKTIQPQELEEVYKDPTYNAIKNNLKDAARKFREYDCRKLKKHLLVVFSKDIIANDIYSVLTGQFSPDLALRIYPSGMVLSKKHRDYIDAVAWFKKSSDPVPNYVWATSKSFQIYFPSTFRRTK